MFLINRDYWEIKNTKDKGVGVFAKKEIAEGAVIGDYIGKVIKTGEYDVEKDKDGLYLMYFTDEAAIYPNLKKPGVHFFNHSCKPNCQMYFYKGHTLFVATEKIKAEDELTISYMLSPKDTCDDCTHDCKCNTKFCTGTMHLTKNKYKRWQNYQENQKKGTKISKPTFGKNLPLLNFYPIKIPAKNFYKG